MRYTTKIVSIESIILLTSALVFLMPTTTNAQTYGACVSADGSTSFAANTQAECNTVCAAAGVTCNFIPNPPGSTSQPGDGTTLPNPIGESDPRKIIGNIIKVILGIVGSITLAIFIYGGLLWMTSSGNTERIKKGRDTLVWATIGLMVIFGSYTVVNFVIQSITKTTP